MTARIKFFKWNNFVLYGIIGCLLFTSLLFLGINGSNPASNARFEGNDDARLFSTADEANIIFSYYGASDTIAELFEPTYIYCILENLGNATAYNISISLLSRLETAPSFIIEEIQNYSPLGPSKSSFLIEFPVQKSAVGNYSYIINVCYNYTSEAKTYQKTLNSTILQVLVVLVMPSITFYGIVENGVTTLVAQFYNYNFYANLTYRFLIQLPDSAPEIFCIEVPGSLFNPNLTMRLDYTITFNPNQLDFWDKLIYYWNGEIEREVRLFYQVSVNDTTGAVHPVSIEFDGSITVINSTHFSLPLSLETNSMAFLGYILIIIVGIIGFEILKGRVGKKEKKLALDFPEKQID